MQEDKNDVQNPADAASASAADSSAPASGTDKTAEQTAKELEQTKRELAQAQHAIIELKKSKDAPKGNESTTANTDPRLDALFTAEEDRQISALTQDPDMQQSIRNALRSKLSRTNNLSQDVRDAYNLVSAPIFEKKLSEMQKAGDGQAGTGHSGSGAAAGEMNPDKPTHGWTKEQLAAIKAKGIDPDTAWKNYKKYENK